jgi:hypothetical protein
MSKKPLLPLHPVEIFLKSLQFLENMPTYLDRNFSTPTQLPPTLNLLRIFRSGSRFGYRFGVAKLGSFPFAWKQ